MIMVTGHGKATRRPEAGENGFENSLSLSDTSTESRVLRCKRGSRSPQATRALILTVGSFDLGPGLVCGALISRALDSYLGAPRCEAEVADQL